MPLQTYHKMTFYHAGKCSTVDYKCVCVCVKQVLGCRRMGPLKEIFLIIVKILRIFSNLFGALPYSWVTLALEENDFAWKHKIVVVH